MAIHRSFANVAAKQAFAINDIIDGLKEQSNKDFDFFKTCVQRAVDTMDLGGPLLYSALIDGSPYKSLRDSHNAHLRALFLRESGIETLNLDMSKNLSEQVLKMNVEELKESKRAGGDFVLPQNSGPK